MTTGNDDAAGDAAGEERVLLFVAGRRDRELVADQLDGHTTVVGDPAEPLPAFDLCIVDTATFPRVADALADRRDAAAPVNVPVLALLGPRDGDAAAREVMGVADDVVSVPTASEVLSARIDSLLRTRRQSLALADTREELALHHRAMAQATVGISIAEADGDEPLTYVNEAFETITGYDRERVLGRNCRFLQGEATDPDAVAELREAIDAGEPVTTELVNYRADGDPFWNRLTITPVADDSGALTHFLGFQRDVTEERELRADLADERAMLSRLLNTSPVGIVLLDGDGDIVRVNPAAEEIFGRSESALTAASFDDESWGIVNERGDPIPADDLPFSRVVNHGETVLGYEHGILRDGERRWLSINAAPLDHADGSTDVVATVNDVTDRTEYARRLTVLDRVLRHNLRNKLNVVAGQAELATAAADAPRVHQATDEITAAAEDLLDVADAVRQFHGTVDPTNTEQVGPNDLAAAVRNAVADVRLDHDAVTFAVDAPESVWASAHDLVEPMLTELLDAMADGDDHTVDVSVRADGDEAVVCIAHDGDPLAAAAVNALKAGEESSLEHTTDVELWLARWMAANSGGRLTVEDTDDNGVRVALHFPAATAPSGDR